MRRPLAGACAFLAMTAAVIALPVYAVPGPAAEPVAIEIDRLDLGSTEAPSAAADVAPAAEALPDLVGELPADAQPGAQPVHADDPVLSFSRRSVDDFSALGVTWAVEEAVTDVTVRLRTRASDGTWQDWTDLQADDVEQTPTDGRVAVRDGTPPVWTGASTAVEVRVTAASEEQPRDVQVELIDPGRSAADAVPGRPEAKAVAHAAAAMPPVYSRAQWGADESIRTWDPRYPPAIKAATLHHTADANGYTADQVPAIMRSIYAYHTKSRGFGDIGYNAIVDRFGRTWEGRYGGLSSTVKGAHAGGFNSGTFGVSMLGDYSKVDTPQAMLKSVATIVAWKFSLYGVDPRGTVRLTSEGGGTSRYAAGTEVTLPTFFAHRDVGSTACPGQYAYNRMGQLRDMVTAILPTFQTPTGSLDAVTAHEEQLTIEGWAFDPDEPTSVLAVHLYVDGVLRSGVGAHRPRADVAAAYPGVGPAHGFRAVLPAAAGTREVCAYAINVGKGTVNTGLGCRRVSVRPVSHLPHGSLDRVSVLGHKVGFSGWTFDRDSATEPLAVHLYLDGRFAVAVRAAGQRDDVAEHFLGVGPLHGFAGELPVTPGQHRLCAYAINVGAGSGNPSLGCSDLTVGGAEALNPIGSVDSATVTAGRLSLSGWTIDPDQPTTVVPVHVYVDGQLLTAVGAAGNRTDLVPLYPSAGALHGFTGGAPLDEGKHTVCVFAINQGAGTGNPALGCRSVDVPVGTWKPIGHLDSARPDSRSIAVSGWSLDPDVPAAQLTMRVFVDGALAAEAQAAQPRADIATAYPAAGEAHGYQLSVPVTAGTHKVCVEAVNQGWGPAGAQLGCRSVTTAAADYDPIGSLDSAQRTGSAIGISGWAFDPDRPEDPLEVHVYVDGAPQVALWTGEQRDDVAAAVPGAGPRTGYAGTVQVGPGDHKVCVYAINVADGQGNPLLGCRTVPA